MSPLFDRESGRAPQFPLLGAFLVLTLVLATWLGYEAVAAAGSHRQTAESVLSDYAEISLSSFTRTARGNLEDALREALGSVDWDLRDFDDRLPNPWRIERDLDDAAEEAGCGRRECEAIQSPLLVFTAELRTGTVRSIPDSVSNARVLALSEAIVASRPDPGRSYIQGMLTAPAGRFFPDSVAIGYGVALDSLRGARVMGFVVPVRAIEELFDVWFARRRLLPDPIGAELPNDSLLQVTVRDPGGMTLYRSAVDYPTTLSASRSLGPENGDMVVEIAMRPDQASQLIIGGLPNSRLPLLITLLLLTLGVGAAALVQFRQEVEFQRLRDDFVSGVSHELRTPLAQIRMFAELQDADKLTSREDRRRANAVIHREARRLSHLVDNILQFSKLRHAGGPGMPREDLDLAEALDDGVDAMSSLLRDRSMSLRFEAERGLRVHANREALTRVVVNLLDNAAKYGPEGQEVRVDLRRVNGDARLTVEDEGPGVPPSDRNRVWKAYRRLERDVKARLPGTGIGLSVVSELVAIHGGQVRVEDAEGGGARFVVELPLVDDGGVRENGVLPATPERRALPTGQGTPVAMHE